MPAVEKQYASNGKAIGLIILFYLSIECCCRNVPISRSDEPSVRGNATHSQATIQICGSALTDMIMHLCGGKIRSFGEVGDSKTDNRKLYEAVRNGAAHKCCTQLCNRDSLLFYCDDKTPESELHTTLLPKSPLNNELPNRVKEDKGLKPGGEQRRSKSGRLTFRQKYGMQKVRVQHRDAKRPKKTGKSRKRGSKRRKPHFKWECVYKSFGHYLLKLDHDMKIRNKIRKKEDLMHIPIQVGTISPQDLGGNPTVVASRFGSATFPRRF